MGDPWGIKSFRGGGSPILSKSSKNRSKNLKNRRNRKKNRENLIFFTENGLKCLRNPTKHL